MSWHPVLLAAGLLMSAAMAGAAETDCLEDGGLRMCTKSTLSPLATVSASSCAGWATKELVES